jgi:hypothetical protein
MITGKDKKTVKQDDLANRWNAKTIASVSLFCFLCSLTLFISSGRFVNFAVTAKWFGMTVWIGFAGLLFTGITLMKAEMKWNIVAHKSLADVKIQSSTVSSIKQEMLQLIRKWETTEPATDNRTDVQPSKTKPGQDDLSENENPKGLLPP